MCLNVYLTVTFRFFYSSGLVYRFPEAQQELAALMTEESIKNVPFLILGNKVCTLLFLCSRDSLLFFITNSITRILICHDLF
jgi:hypothetical protein